MRVIGKPGSAGEDAGFGNDPAETDLPELACLAREKVIRQEYIAARDGLVGGAYDIRQPLRIAFGSREQQHLMYGRRQHIKGAAHERVELFEHVRVKQCRRAPIATFVA